MGSRALALNRSGVAPYLYVFIGVTGALGACLFLVQMTGNHRGYGAVFWGVLLVSAMWWGRGPGVFAALTSCAAMALFLFAEAHASGVAVMFLSMAAAAYVVGTPPARLEAAADRPPAIKARGLWNPKVSGEYAIDCAAGAEAADLFLASDPKHYRLGLIARDMIARGRFSGVEAGFFHRISESCTENVNIQEFGLMAEHNPQDVDLQPGVIETDGEVRPPTVGH